jgi:tRNA A37 threonylcarbamoyladenosine synthetase subunit TsaC/SUA5/YrdC
MSQGYSQIAQFLGPAKAPGASQEALSTLLPGPILIESKRLTKEGITKLKLSLLGVRVTKCPICLAQFREGELGVIIPGCGHLGHEKCVRRWFREDDRCFVCRVRLKVEEGVV